MTKIIIKVFIFLHLCLLAANQLHAQPWAHESSKIPKDPDINYGKLDNGLKYAWYNTEEEKDKSCLMRLIVHVGSFHETESELGMAHFLEHMAFAGSKNFPDTSAINFLQKIGILFGPHFNASTNITETIYKINLPHCTSDYFKKALNIFRDFADGLLLNEDAIKKEGRIIDQEEAFRYKHTQEEFMNKLFQGTKYSTRPPGGDKNIYKNFSRKNFNDFYKKWYRPDNMTLILIGNLQNNPEKDINEIFASMKKAENSSSDNLDLNIGVLPTKKRALLRSNSKTEILTISVTRRRNQNFTKKYFFHQKKIQLAHKAYEYAVSQQTPRNNYALETINSTLHDLDLTGISLSLKNTMKSDLSQAISQHNSLLENGINDQQFKAAISSIKSQDQDKEHESANNILSELIDDATGEYPRIKKDTYKNLCKEFYKKITIDELNAFIRTHFSIKNILNSNFFINGYFGEEDDKTIFEQVENIIKSSSNTVNSLETKNITPLKFAYKSKEKTTPSEIKITENTTFNFKELEFQNGVKANLKVNKDPENPNKILIKVKMGHGYSEYEDQEKPLAILGGESLKVGGTKKHTFHHFNILTQGKDFNLNFEIKPNESHFSGETSPRDLLDFLEWNRAYISDATLRESEINKKKPIVIHNLRKDHFNHLFEDHPQLSTLNEETIKDIKAKDVQSFMREKVLNRCPEFNIVGNVDLEKTIQYLDQTFGDLQCTTIPQKKQKPQKLDIKFKTHKNVSINTSDSKAQVIVFIPINKFVENRYNQIIIQLLIQDRIFSKLRETLNIIYVQPEVIINDSNYSSKLLLKIEAFTTEEHTEKAIAEITKIVNELITDLSREELETCKKQILDWAKLLLSYSSFWLDILSQGNFVEGSSIEEVIKKNLSATQEQILSEMQGMIEPENYSTLTLIPSPR